MNSAPRTESLDFLVKPVETPEELTEALKCRATAYGHHFPFLRDRLLTVEGRDIDATGIVLVAISKSDGRCIGTVRVSTNAAAQLEAEELTTLPQSLAGKRIAEVSRLAIPSKRGGALVKLALFKACLHWCLAQSIDTIVINGRRPLDREYLLLGFSDTAEGEAWFRHPRADNAEVRLLCMDLENVEAKAAAHSNRLHEFMFLTEHPDIRIERRSLPATTAPKEPRSAAAVQLSYK